MRRELADHRVAHRRDQQFADALQHVAQEQPEEGRAPGRGIGQCNAQRQDEVAGAHQHDRRGELLGHVDAPAALAQEAEQRRQQRPAEDDDDGVDVLHPLRLDAQTEQQRIDVAIEEQGQAAGLDLVERPEHERADGQYQVSPHVAALPSRRVVQRHPGQRQEHERADHLDDDRGGVRVLQKRPHDGHEPDQDGQAGQAALAELVGRRVQQRRLAIREHAPIAGGQHDGDQVAERGEREQRPPAARLVVEPGDQDADEEADVHARVVPQERAFAARVVRRETLREHHVDAGHVQPAAGQEKGQPPVQKRAAARGDQAAAQHLQRHAADEQVAVAEEASAQIAPEQVQPIVEGAEQAHQRQRQVVAEMQVLGRVEHQRGLQHGIAERRERLDEEQGGRAFRDLVQLGFEGRHGGLAFDGGTAPAVAAAGSARNHSRRGLRPGQGRSPIQVEQVDVWPQCC